MSILDKLRVIKENNQIIETEKENIRLSIESKGVDIPYDTTLGEYSNKIYSIQTGVTNSEIETIFDTIIQEANLKGAEIPLNADYPEIILGLQRITLGLPQAEVEALLDEILGETIVGDYEDKGASILSEKESIRQAIIAKEVPVPVETPLSQFPAKIAEIETGGGGIPEWVYPLEWPEIRDVGDDEIKLLVTDDYRLRLQTYSENRCNISWGDGTPDSTVSNYNTVAHDYTNASGYTIDPLSGRKLWLVRITPLSTGHIRMVRFNRPYDTYGPSTTPIVAAAFGGKYFTAWYGGQYSPFYSSGFRTYSHFLVYCKIKSFGTATNAQSLFNNCISLKAVDLPSSFGTITDASYFFNYCTSLQKVVVPEWGNVSTAYYMLGYCSNLEEITLPTSWGANMTVDNSFVGPSSLFYGCTRLKNITLPNSWGVVRSVANMFNSCVSLNSIVLPDSWGDVKYANSMFASCSSLENINLPSSWGEITTLEYFFSSATRIKNILVPTFDNVTSAAYMFYNCSSLHSCQISGWGVMTNITNMFYGCKMLRYITFPSSNGASLITCNSIVDYYATSGIIKFTNLDFVGSTVTDTDFTTFIASQMEPIVLTLYARIKKLGLAGQNAYPTNITSLRLPNAVNSLFGGSSPQIDVSYTNLDATALNNLFTDLPTIAGKTIKITRALGAATCDKTIATAKGWTVTT